MLTVQNFVSQYEKFSDEDLYQAYSNIEDYSEQGKEALLITIETRGGLEKLAEKKRKLQTIEKEKQRIAFEVKKLCVADTDLDFLKRLIKSDILSPEATEQVIFDTYNEQVKTREDLAVKPRTIIGSLVGGTLGSVIGGGLWGLQMIQMHRMFYIFIVGLIILSYSLIKFFTKQSKANTAVGIATLLSVVAALLFGQILFEIYG